MAHQSASGVPRVRGRTSGGCGEKGDPGFFLGDDRAAWPVPGWRKSLRVHWRLEKAFGLAEGGLGGLGEGARTNLGVGGESDSF